MWLVAVVATGCATPGVVRTPAPSLLGTEWTGLASWYGDPHHGRETASGEVFDKTKPTAAHRALPFGTRLAVTNLDNGRTVEVRVNDRGPFVNGRIIDLSEAAARRLGGIGTGLMRVRVRVVGLPDGTTETARGKPPER
ncbi:MAG: septal ring lytic transglycosylase RlpA family lipoprotein [Candidatus Rokuibacteriota bacterium]|nr:MAG: septal ring lytic transglycosylase RlpA family lipoprotein [Candidatus Rokubacteria bacterium]